MIRNARLAAVAVLIATALVVPSSALAREGELLAEDSGGIVDITVETRVRLVDLTGTLTNIQQLQLLYNQDILKKAEFTQGQEKELKNVEETIITQLDQGKVSTEDIGKILTKLTEAKDQHLIPDKNFEKMRSFLVQRLV